MKAFFQEFRDFAMRGNVVDLAVGVVIGSAFSAIVTSLVGDVFSPLIGLFFNSDLSALAVQVGEVSIAYGAFLTAIINFLITAFALFLFIKAMNSAKALVHKQEEAASAAPTTKTCPYCKSEIAIDATRCAHCTSELPQD